MRLPDKTFFTAQKAFGLLSSKLAGHEVNRKARQEQPKLIKTLMGVAAAATVGGGGLSLAGMIKDNPRMILAGFGTIGAAITGLSVSAVRQSRSPEAKLANEVVFELIARNRPARFKAIEAGLPEPPRMTLAELEAQHRKQHGRAVNNLDEATDHLLGGSHTLPMGSMSKLRESGKPLALDQVAKLLDEQS